MNRYAPLLVLLAVTALFLGYGRHPWSWLAGPVASLVVWGLDRMAREPEAAPAPLQPEPAPVD
ncbi:MAG: hypothetical protein HOQ28_12355 [Thermoleophilia bacterium]|nr:hypothetical protein [Thermoleophilia bacterium]